MTASGIRASLQFIEHLDLERKCEAVAQNKQRAMREQTKDTKCVFAMSIHALKRFSVSTRTRARLEMGTDQPLSNARKGAWGAGRSNAPQGKSRILLKIGRISGAVRVVETPTTVGEERNSSMHKQPYNGAWFPVLLHRMS